MKVSVKQLRKETNNPLESYNLKIREFNTLRREETEEIESVTRGNILNNTNDVRETRKEAIRTKNFEPTDFAYERAIGRNDSLYSNFTELIALTKRKVGRIVIIEDGRRTGYATGFMVSNKLLLTNWHVFKYKDMAEESEIQFFYEYDSDGHPLNPVIFKFDTSGFFNNEELDYCFVEIKPTDVTGKVSLESIGYLYLDKTLGKIGEVDVEKLNIIHHPQGDYKQISIRENTFTGIEPTKIFYKTDTAQGSSGSPVFNDQWQVVGLHHKSIAKMSEDGKDYLDKNDQVIPIVDDKIDSARVVWLKNEGIRISVILNHLLKKNPNDNLVAGLNIPPPKESLYFTANAADNLPMKAIVSSSVVDENKNININVPAGLLNSDKSIEISLSSKHISTSGRLERDKTSTTEISELFLEVAKAEKEGKVDFSKCKGYDPKFLGVDIHLPQPKGNIKKQIARLNHTEEIELKYFKYSVIFNAVTHMALISAVNVEGDEDKRKDNSKRNDDWLRDNRIDTESQLTDKFYAKSKFDKGHMSRFEDANWDNTKKEAFRNGIFTCFYTNACPQAVKLNRAGGLWGKLEKAVLEKGVKKQEGKQMRISVLNGPIFDDKKNKVFKGFQIPMEFFKIILWPNDKNQLRATAFKLSQELLVNDIKFDESMHLDEEALDIDKDITFKHYQCSIKSLDTLTHIDFKHLEQYDTFKAKNGGEENLIVDTEAIIL